MKRLVKQSRIQCIYEERSTIHQRGWTRNGDDESKEKENEVGDRGSISTEFK